MAGVPLIYQQNSALNEIDQIMLPQLTEDDLIHKLFPTGTTPAAQVTWEQRDSYTGLMQMRGYNSPSPSIPKFGFNRFTMRPGVWGEKDIIDEQEITERATPGTWATPIDVSDLVAERHVRLLHRQNNRRRHILWQLVALGLYQIPDDENKTIYTESYIPQVFTQTVLWHGNPSTATPLLDYRNIFLKHRGQSVTFGRQAQSVMSYKSYIDLIANTNAADLYGRRATGLSTINSLDQYNAEIALKDDLPTIVIYDETYLDDTGATQTFLPDNTEVTIGKRTNNAPIGRFTYTRNAQAPGMASGPHVVIADSMSQDNPMPEGAVVLAFDGTRRLEIHRGFNGGPEIHYPGAVVIMKSA